MLTTPIRSHPEGEPPFPLDKVCHCPFKLGMCGSGTQFSSGAEVGPGGSSFMAPDPCSTKVRQGTVF